MPFRSDARGFPRHHESAQYQDLHSAVQASRGRRSVLGTMALIISRLWRPRLQSRSHLHFSTTTKFLKIKKLKVRTI